MRCPNVRKILEEGQPEEAEVQAHLKSCRACAEVAAEWRLIRAGWRELREQKPPEIPWGFTERLRRRLEAAVQHPSEEFIEVAGRRMVYATLLLTLLVLLSLVVPSSGPLRARSRAEVLLARPPVVEVSEAAPIAPGALEAGWASRSGARGLAHK